MEVIALKGNKYKYERERERESNTRCKACSNNRTSRDSRKYIHSLQEIMEFFLSNKTHQDDGLHYCPQPSPIQTSQEEKYSIQ